MRIKINEFKKLEKRVADLEKNQLQSADMVKRYIQDSESLSNKLSEMIRKLPETLEAVLCKYSSNE